MEDAYFTVKAIVRNLVDVKRVTMRDKKGYCAILLDDTNRKPVCRLWFNSDPKRLGLFDAGKVEERHDIACMDDIYHHADVIRATVARYLGHDSAP